VAGGNWPTLYVQSKKLDTGKFNSWADICTLEMANGCGFAYTSLIVSAPELRTNLNTAVVAMKRAESEMQSCHSVLQAWATEDIDVPACVQEALDHLNAALEHVRHLCRPNV
jgi:hypothetical protein